MTMDFEASAQRLERDQKKIRGRRDMAVSQKAKRQVEYQRKQQAKLRVDRERKKRLEHYQKHYMQNCDRALHTKSLSSPSSGSGSSSSSLSLKATSIYGEGDKITLPPSVLQVLTAEETTTLGNPWTFRIGILNPEYTFPSSALIHTLKPPEEDDDDAMLEDSDDESDDDNKAAYLEELSYKYIAYTHCTVVEFTQDEGHVGIPPPIASALLNQQNTNATIANIPKTRTVDPAQKSAEDDNTTTTTTTTTAVDSRNAADTQTPGHVAWGAFDIPDMPLEITLVKMPKGRGCTLVPTKEAIQNNFYGLEDVKLVLEQSLIRTRATLSLGDVVSTWHRGVKFDLDVTKVLPSAFHAVTCINTDIEVDIGQVEEEKTSTSQHQQPKPEQGHKLGTGQTLTTTTSTTTGTNMTPPAPSTTISKILLPEPPEDQKEGVCVIQIRYSGGHGKRRFDIHKSNVKDLSAYAASLIGKDERTFRLVTRFPRRVFSMDEHGSSALADAGIQQGQEMFMVELL
jgi:hypothetical protein